MEKWQCSGCGAISEDRERVCDCPTSSLYRLAKNGLEHEVKIDCGSGHAVQSELLEEMACVLLQLKQGFQDENLSRHTSMDEIWENVWRRHTAVIARYEEMKSFEGLKVK